MTPTVVECSRYAVPDSIGQPESVSSLKVALEKAVRAVGGGREAEQLVDGLDDYLETHPAAVHNMTHQALDGLSSMFKHKSETNVTTQAPAVLSTTAAQAAVATAPASDPGTVFGTLLTDERMDRFRSVQNPWVITGFAAMVASICMGIAMGALCQARLIYRGSQAREPLLAGGGSSEVHLNDMNAATTADMA